MKLEQKKNYRPKQDTTVTTATIGNETVQSTKTEWKRNVLLSTPTLGWIRYEWSHSRYGQTIPINWGMQGFDLAYTTLGYGIDDAYNLIAAKALETRSQWLITHEDDVILPIDAFVKMDRYISKGDIPIVSGLYFAKAMPPQPLVFRGRGTGTFEDFKLGDKVWCDGLPMGFLLIHCSIIEWFWDNSPKYNLPTGEAVSRVFESPRKAWNDKVGGYIKQSGTQDLYFFDRIYREDVFKKTGWGKYAKMRYPLLCDTGIYCRHVDRATGRMYPS
jgi:hypothetical protein